MSLICNLNEHKHAALREMLRKCPNLCRDTLGNEPISSWRPFEQNLKGIGDSLGNAQRGLKTFSAMHTEKWRQDGCISFWVSSQ
jgi:hypothetical protein